MDIVSHGLWGAVAFGRKNRFSFWLAFFFGLAPDLFSFGILFVQNIFTHAWDFSAPPALESIPGYVFTLYDVTHSFLIFAVMFALALFFVQRPVWEMSAWAFHILLDIFTHSDKFFPTPFLWPISDYTFSGMPWSDLRIYIPNLALLTIAYIWFYKKRPN